ncbi:MAG: glycoside hydrolase family 88 protein [Verrucomicrobiota bacterium]
MKTYLFVILMIIVGLLPVTAGPKEPNNSEAVRSVMKRVADWQIENLRIDYDRYHEADNRLVAWTYGALYVGMLKWAEIADDEQYYDFLKSIGEELNWDLGRAKYHADEQIVGQLHLELYRKYKDPRMLDKTRERTEWIRDNPSQQPINLNNYKYTQRWTWCDALFMAPPVWAKLSNITGDPSFNEFMFKEFQATVDHLYDEEEKLFFRDEHFIEKRAHGRKVFWSRGNGWVFGGLALIIPELPEGDQKKYFIKLFQEMAPAVAKLQTEQGHWAMSLLAADVYPTPETSGSAFFTYGLAWGINQGYLDRETYEPVIVKGWNSLVSHVTEDGMLGYVQPVGASPGQAWPDRTEVYGTGAFLAAGSEVYKLFLNPK